MTKNQLLALAAFITSLANSEDTATTATAPDAASGEAPSKPKRGRPPVEKPAEPQAEEKAPEEKAEAVTGKTYEELQALIRPLVEAGQGADVKLVIAKYGENLKAVAGKPETHAAFEKDISALSY